MATWRHRKGETNAMAERTVTTIVNLTPHPLIVFDGDTVVFEQPPLGPPARIVEQRGNPTTLEVAGRGVGLPLVRVGYDDHVAGLPSPKPGVVYVVSRVTAAHLAGNRDDLLFPLEEVRDTSGRIIGCRLLGCFESQKDAQE